MLKTIAWATDHSPSARNALTTAKELARQTGARLAIIYVHPSTIGRTALLLDSDEAAVNALHRTAQELRDEGIETTVLVSRTTAAGVPGTIVELADEAGADVIVIGNRGHGPLTGFVLGSVAHRLLRTAPRPVIMVPSRRPAEPAQPAGDRAAAAVG